MSDYLLIWGILALVVLIGILLSILSSAYNKRMYEIEELIQSENCYNGKEPSNSKTQT